jgi:D-alanyl-D-alanine carboxypeptidase/D-alanyl-D-alanine-endopeptidase (penicillin-binding protein 4)
MVVATLAVLCMFTVGAGVATVRMLPARLALLRVVQVSDAGPVGPGAALPGDFDSAHPGQATPAGVSAQISALIAGGGLGHNPGALVTDLATGRVLYALNASTGFTPASTTKLATAVAALHVLGPGATFTTSVLARSGAGLAGANKDIVLVGGGDPTLAAGRFPGADYPQPATLSSLAAATARDLKAKKVTSVRLSYDASLFHGPVVAQGWPGYSYIMSGNVAPITGLEVDQGRLVRPGVPQDMDFSGVALRSMTPGPDAARFFARFLRKDGVAVRGPLSSVAAKDRAGYTVIAAIHSPPLAQIVQQMLAESNNVIAETLARHVAVAIGMPGTFSGAAHAVMTVDGKLGVRGIALHDGSGLSPLDLISPQALVRLVRLAAKGPGVLRPTITGLPVAGFYGTLGPQSLFGPFGSVALGTVRAKTGNLTGVATMAGIAYARTGQLIAFAFMGNNLPAKLGARPEMTLAQLATVLAGCGCRLPSG